MKKYIFFGAGKLGKRYLELAEDAELEIVAFCDNDKTRWGTQYCGKSIISPDMLRQKEYSDCVVVVSMIHAKEVYKQLEDMGIAGEEDFYNKIISRRKGLEFCFENENLSSVNDSRTDSLLVVVDARDCTEEETKKCISTLMANTVKEKYELIVWRKQNNCPTANGKRVLLLNGASIINVNGIDNLLFSYAESACIVGAKEIDENNKIIQAGFEEINGEWTPRGNKETFFKDRYSYAKRVGYLKNNGVLMPCKFWDLYRKKLLAGTDEILAWMEVQQNAIEQDYELCMQPYAMIMSNRTKAECWNESFLKRVHENVSFVRHISKEQILMCDWEIARYDTNAGHRSTHTYIQLLKELGKEIVYLVCAVDIFSPYIEYYQKQGIYVVYNEKYYSRCEDFLRNEVGEITYAFINRPQVAEKFVPLLRHYPNMKIAHYGHDLHYLRMLRAYEVTGDERTREEAEKMRALEYSLIEQVDYTGYPSNVEVEILKKEFPNANIECFPLLYFDKKPCEPKNKGREGVLFVGGFRHEPNVDAAIWLMEEILPELRSRGINDKVYIVGSNPTEKMLEYASEEIIITGFVSDDELKELYQSCRVCIAPLRYGAGMKGKVLEAMYNGILFVTTDIGAEGLVNVEKVIGVANTVTGIVDEVQKLGEYDELQVTERIKSAQTYIMDNFSKETLLNMLQRQMRGE